MNNFLKKHLKFVLLFTGDVIIVFAYIICIEEVRKELINSPITTIISFIIILAMIDFLAIGIIYSIKALLNYLEVIKVHDPRENEYRDYLVNKINTESDDHLARELQSLFSESSCEEHKDSMVESLYEKHKDSKDIIALMLKNNDELTEYFQISKSQSRWSFWLSTIACISGIIILGITVYSVIILKQTDIAVVGVISGAITEVIAGTIFWLHNKSALQLNHYYDALHENEKVLLAINLTNTLSPEERESMCKEIIRTQIYKQKCDK